MHRLLPPLCLLLALAMLVTAFGLMAVEPPEPGIELHRARAVGDEDYRDVLEAKLARQVTARKVLLVSLFAASGVLTITAFLSMRPAA